MRFFRRTVSTMSRWEWVLLLLFLTLLGVSSLALLRRFYIEHTEIIPVRGGTYIEGSVGTIRMLNPWFTVTNDVNRDITSLVFSGLQRYNPFSSQIENDMAELEISGNNRIYTLTLRENLWWHDSTPEQPRPVTADDVLFTYQTILQQGFPNPILQKNFRGIDIEKIDDHTVQFRLERPYYFFRSNLTLGILPTHRFEGVPPDRLLEALDFNLSPTGSGPYQFKSIVETELSTEVTLELFPQYHGATPYINQIVFRAFPDYPSLLSDLRNLDGVRHVPRNPQGRPIIPQRYNTFLYTLPQYVALFFNMEREALKDTKLRLGLQLGTNKKAVADAINEHIIIDTPLLEFSTKDWQYQFQPDAAQGALYDSAWNLPEKVRLQHLLENRAINETGALLLPQSTVLLNTGAALVLTGSFLPVEKFLAVNGLPVQPLPANAQNAPEQGAGDQRSWFVVLPTDGSSGSILLGENALKLTGTGEKAIDTFILTRVADRTALEQLRNEQTIVDLYRERGDDITIDDLRLENSLLRSKKAGEPHGIRLNDRGEPLHLRLLTSPLPSTYKVVAEEIARQWRAIGVDVVVEVPDVREAFDDRVIRRDYDVLLFGQPLLENLDSYPYWHSSQIQVFEDEGEEGASAGGQDEGEESEKEEGGAVQEKKSLRLDANNLSQYTNFRTDALLEQIRETHDPEKRKLSLELLREVFREHIPAIVLYSPTYVFAVSERILGVDLGTPSLHSDRFLSMHRWFIKQGRTFRPGTSWWDVPSWVLRVSRPV